MCCVTSKVCQLSESDGNSTIPSPPRHEAVNATHVAANRVAAALERQGFSSVVARQAPAHQS